MYPGALESQWIPMDERLWKLANDRDFLGARRSLLAKAANAFLDKLYPKHMEELEAVGKPIEVTPADAQVASVGADIPGGVDNGKE